MPSVTKSGSSSISATSRTAARIRMRELAAAAAAKNPKKAQTSSSQGHVQNDPSSPCRLTFPPPHISEGGIHDISSRAVNAMAVHETAYEEKYPSIPVLLPYAQTEEPRQDSPNQYHGQGNIDHRLSLSKTPQHADRKLEEGTRFGRGGWSRVKLYRGPSDDEERDYFDRNEDDPMDLDYDDMTYDSPYLPGPSSTNKLRCMTWLRNVPKNEDLACQMKEPYNEHSSH